jgi:deoxyadenosine/deoxycytidine kinase
MKKKGKLLTLVGSPASGKTFLANILKKKFNAELILEEPNTGFPREIQENFKNKKNYLEIVLWFRNHEISNYIKALELINQGKNVILDTPFYQYQLYLDLYIQEPFVKNIFCTISEQDFITYPQPDITIHISTTKQLMKEFLLKRNGHWEWEKDDWFSFIENMPSYAERFIKTNKSKLNNLIIIERSEYDFYLEKDINKLLMTIEEKLAISP